MLDVLPPCRASISECVLRCLLFRVSHDTRLYGAEQLSPWQRSVSANSSYYGFTD